MNPLEHPGGRGAHMFLVGSALFLAEPSLVEFRPILLE
jgi:hypothetical protein